jgi:hypothetical protein
MRRDYRGSRGKLRLGTVYKSISRWQCWANQEANLLERLVVHGVKNPITNLDGISAYDQARLLEEGIKNIENLAHSNFPEVLLRTRIPSH